MHLKVIRNIKQRSDWIKFRNKNFFVWWEDNGLKEARMGIERSNKSLHSSSYNRMAS